MGVQGHHLAFWWLLIALALAVFWDQARGSLVSVPAVAALFYWYFIETPGSLRKAKGRTYSLRRLWVPWGRLLIWHKFRVRAPGGLAIFEGHLNPEYRMESVMEYGRQLHRNLSALARKPGLYLFTTPFTLPKPMREAGACWVAKGHLLVPDPPLWGKGRQSLVQGRGLLPFKHSLTTWLVLVEGQPEEGAKQ